MKKIKFYCAFCGRNEHEVRLVAGPAATCICEHCIGAAAGVLARPKNASRATPYLIPPPERRIEAKPPVGDLDPAFRALVDGRISVGRMREIVTDWRLGRPFHLPDDAEDGGGR